MPIYSSDDVWTTCNSTCIVCIFVWTELSLSSYVPLFYVVYPMAMGLWRPRQLIALALRIAPSFGRLHLACALAGDDRHGGLVGRRRPCRGAPALVLWTTALSLSSSLNSLCVSCVAAAQLVLELGYPKFSVPIPYKIIIYAFSKVCFRIICSCELLPWKFKLS